MLCEACIMPFEPFLRAHEGHCGKHVQRLTRYFAEINRDKVLCGFSRLNPKDTEEAVFASFEP